MADLENPVRFFRHAATRNRAHGPAGNDRVFDNGNGAGGVPKYAALQASFIARLER